MGKPVGTLSGRQAAKLVGVKYPTLARWVGQGLLSPERYEGAKGRNGYAYAWRLHDALAARTLRELRERLSMQKLRRALDVLRDSGGDLYGSVLVIDGDDLCRVVKGEQLVSLLKNPTAAYIYPLGSWARETRAGFDAALAGADREERKAG